MTLVTALLGILVLYWYIEETQPELVLSILANIKRWIRQDVTRRAGRMEAKAFAQDFQDTADKLGIPPEITDSYIDERMPDWVAFMGQKRAHVILGDEHWLETDY